MRADVAEAAGSAGLARIGPPACLLLFLLLQPSPQPALDVRRADRVDLSQLAGQDHVPRLAHEGVAGVVMRESENDAGSLDDPGQLLRLRQVERHRLVAHDVQAGFRRGLRQFGGVVGAFARDVDNDDAPFRHVRPRQAHDLHFLGGLQKGSFAGRAGSGWKLVTVL